MSAASGAPATIRQETRRLRIGFIPLIDCAILVAAVELGFAAREGIALELVREVSWSNIRDRLAFGQFDAAHLLGAMAVASQVGIGTNPFPVIAPMALGRGGNAITLSTALVEAMDKSDPGEHGASPVLAAAKRLAAVVRKRARAGLAPLVFGVVYPFSSHNYEFRHWLAAGGIDPDRDLRITVVPPPLTTDALATGAIDGFCVNAPWNVLAVKRGVGRIVAVKADIWPSAPEKVLGLRPDFAERHPETTGRLLRALDGAARWCDMPGNRADLAALLAGPRYLDTEPGILQALLAGDLDIGAERRHIPGYLAFHRDHATFPWKSAALWSYSQMVRWGQVADTPMHRAAAAAAYRPALYREAVGAADLPAGDSRIEGADPLDRFLDGGLFDPDNIDAYLGPFARSRPSATTLD